MTFKPEFLQRVSERRAALSAEVTTLLPVARRIVWEVGCGHGHFLARYASEFPEKSCFGVDICSARIERGQKKATRANLPNCHFVRAEAREFLHALPAEIAIDELWVLFPDPWPKKRHHKNRILQPAFFEAIAGRVGEGAKLYFRTDAVAYFDEVAGFIPGLKTWQLAPADTVWPMEHETVFQARAETYHSLIAVRTSHPATPIETVGPGLPPRAVPT